MKLGKLAVDFAMLEINRMQWTSRFLEALSRPAVIQRLYALLSKAPILGGPIRRLVRGAFPPETRIWCRISTGLGKGLWINVDPRFEMDYVHGNYEIRVEQTLSKHLRPGMVFYDVGAHIGVLTLVGARLVGTEGAVFAFEADPTNAARVEQHVRRNRFEQIHILPNAVWSSGGRLRFERASEQSSLNQGAVAEEQLKMSTNIIAVEGVTLDDFSRTHAPPDLIKIDVEGAEGAVLRGSERIFVTKRPLLICEVHREDSSRDVLRWLRARNYSFEWLAESPNLPRHLFAKWRQ
jgi:FkbM family methyltransferase